MVRTILSHMSAPSLPLLGRDSGGGKSTLGLVYTYMKDNDEKLLNSLNHSLYHSFSLSHSLTHPLIHSLTHSRTLALTHSLTHPLTHTLTHARTHSLTHSLTHSPTLALTHFTHSLTHSRTHSLHSLTHSLSHSLTSLTQSTHACTSSLPTHSLTLSPPLSLTHFFTPSLPASSQGSSSTHHKQVTISIASLVNHIIWGCNVMSTTGVHIF